MIAASVNQWAQCAVVTVKQKANWRSSHLETTTMVGVFGHTGTTVVICQWTRLGLAICLGTRLCLVCQWARLNLAICLGTRLGLVCLKDTGRYEMGQMVYLWFRIVFDGKKG